MSAYFLSNGQAHGEMMTQVDALNHARLYEVLTGGWRRLGGKGDDRLFAQWAKQYTGRTSLQGDGSFDHFREGIARQQRVEALFKERVKQHPDKDLMQKYMARA